MLSVRSPPSAVEITHYLTLESRWKGKAHKYEYHENWNNMTALTNEQRISFLLIIKKMLERREECDTYLIHICRHQRSVENPVKR